MLRKTLSAVGIIAAGIVLYCTLGTEDETPDRDERRQSVTIETASREELYRPDDRGSSHGSRDEFKRDFVDHRREKEDEEDN
ncbi:hypothetical protein [Natronorubrum sp. FCH18a]|uniref:hypothetical protein n=1 Tax=Natronorubrum sp. FCH18a TaxID=3447018 RepID=UPI003F50DBC8